MTSLIKLYGEFWNPDIVDWGKVGAGNQGSLLGKIKTGRENKEVNFWDCQGIYVLMDGFNVVYVGKAFSTSMGKRLRDHLSDRLAGRWDMFSWYSTSNYRKTTNDIKDAGGRITKPETIINTLEALAILIADPRLNRRRESIPDAVEVLQSESVHPKTIRSYLRQILETLDKSSNPAPTP